MEMIRGFRDKISNHADVSREIEVHLTTDGAATYDTCCFGLDINEKMSDDRYTVFYNQSASPERAVVYEKVNSTDKYKLNLSKLPESINKLVFTVSIDNDGRMGEIKEHIVEIIQDNNIVLDLILEGRHFDNEKAIIDIEIYRKGEWRIATVARGFDGGLDALVKNFGGEIAEENNDVVQNTASEEVRNNTEQSKEPVISSDAPDNDELKQILDNIESGLTDDPIEDFRYLKGELGKYTEHKLFEDICKELGKTMFAEIPDMIRKALDLDKSDTVNAFNELISEAGELMKCGQWPAAGMILSTLIGEGIGINDTSTTLFRNFEDDAQRALYKYFFKEENEEIVEFPVRLDLLYGLYGCVLMEFKRPDDAEDILQSSVHFNPFNSGFFFEYMETYKARGNFEEFEKINRAYLPLAYRAVDIGRIYRNLGYVYIEKKDYETAVVLYKYSKVYDPDSNMAEHELAYISHQSGKHVDKLVTHEPVEVMAKAEILNGASPEVIKVFYSNAFIESSLNHNVEKTEYYCKFLYDITRNENLVNELIEVAKDKSRGIICGDGESRKPENELRTVYDEEKEKSLKEVFPDYPEVTECRLKITFTLVSTKYEETVYQILEHIDDISKLIDGKDITLYFADLIAVTKSIKYINDLIAVAVGWKTFKLTINDIPRDKYEFRYFLDMLRETFGVNSIWYRNADDVRKEYKKEKAPKRAKKQNIEDNFEVDLTDCTPQEIITGIANTYASVYLSEYDVKVIRVSDDEIVLSANDDFVVDFWVSPYGYGATMTGTPEEGRDPYEYCTYMIQELTYNKLFKYNGAAFNRIFKETPVPIETLRFNGPDYYRPEINHFHKINTAYPELRLQAKYDEYPGDPFNFIIFEMENADGTIGQAIGFTDKKPRDLLVKVCKELETKTPGNLEGNGANGLVFALSRSFITSFLSWKGEKKTKRLEAHLKYFIVEKTLKNKVNGNKVAEELMKEVYVGNYNDTERKNYSDIGRR